jgi:predicted methyltransferase
MNRFVLAAAALALCAGPAIAAKPAQDAAAVTAAAADAAARIAEAVSASDRPEDARALDESRRPVDVLAWLGLHPGMDAADLVSGTGYWAEIMGRVVGDKGSVTAYEPEQFYSEEKSGPAWTALAARVPQVNLSRYRFEAFAPPANAYDFAIINLNYHDLYWQSDKFGIPRTDPDAFVRNLFAAMRPGGIVGVIDHVGPAGDTRAIVEKMHRIDPATVKADFERAGFVLEDRSDMLANPEDDHTKGVFDPAIRGKTDRFLFKFRKPAA